MPKTEEEEARVKRRRRNRIVNAVLYLICACLILFGVYLILRDQTSLFLRNTAEIPDVTFPPETIPSRTEPAPTVPPAEIVSDAPLPSDTTQPSASASQDETPAPSAAATPTPAAVQTPVPTEEPTIPPDVPANIPVSVYFEGHNVSVKVVPVGVNENGEMESVPKHDVAGWYKYGAAPNQNGNCIIAGHNRWHGRKGLFALLHDGLKVGDPIIVMMEDGSAAFYIVETLERFRYDAVPDRIMDLGGEQRLTLITCLGDYSHILHMSKTRVVAVCKPVK